MRLDDHKTVKRIRSQTEPTPTAGEGRLDSSWLRQVVLDAGADDVGFDKAAYCLAVCPAGEDVMRPYLADKKAHLSVGARKVLTLEPAVVFRG